jgi:hypothetical protein
MKELDFGRFWDDQSSWPGDVDLIFKQLCTFLHVATCISCLPCIAIQYAVLNSSGVSAFREAAKDALVVGELPTLSSRPNFYFVHWCVLVHVHVV